MKHNLYSAICILPMLVAACQKDVNETVVDRPGQIWTDEGRTLVDTDETDQAINDQLLADIDLFNHNYVIKGASETAIPELFAAYVQALSSKIVPDIQTEVTFDKSKDYNRPLSYCFTIKLSKDRQESQTNHCVLLRPSFGQLSSRLNSYFVPDFNRFLNRPLSAEILNSIDASLGGFFARVLAKEETVHGHSFADYFMAMNTQLQNGGVLEPVQVTEKMWESERALKLQLLPESPENSHRGQVKILAISDKLLKVMSSHQGILRGCDGPGCNIPLYYLTFGGQLQIARDDPPNELGSYMTAVGEYFRPDIMSFDHNQVYKPGKLER